MKALVEFLANLGRYARLFRNFVTFSFSRALMFRLDFFFRIVMDCMYYAVNFGFFQLVYGTTAKLGGWRQDETMVFVAIFLLIDAIHMTLFSNNMWVLPLLINKGELDYYLLRPINSLFFVSLRDFAANSFVNLIITMGLLVWALSNYQGEVGWAQIALLIWGVLIGTTVHYLLRILFILPVFWTHSPRGYDGTFHQMARFMERPDRIFSGVVRVVLTTVLPYALVASFPARLFLDGFQIEIALHMAIVTGLFFVFVTWLWSRALKVYSSASS